MSDLNTDAKRGPLVLGLGHCGIQVLTALKELNGSRELALLALDADREDLDSAKNAGLNTLLLGEESLAGRGTGGDREMGEEILNDASEEITRILGKHRVLIAVAALGGGMGGALESLLYLAEDAGIPCVLLALMPFPFESGARRQAAAETLSLLDLHCQAVVLAPNEDIVKSDDDCSAWEAFRAADDYLANAAAALAIPFGTTSFFAMSPRILENLAEDSIPRCLLAQASGSGSSPVEEVMNGLAKEKNLQNMQKYRNIDKAAALLRVNGSCREKDMEALFTRLAELFKDSSLETAACLDKAQAETFRLTLLMHQDANIIIQENGQHTEHLPRKKRRSAKKREDGEQLSFHFQEDKLGIFDGDPKNEINGENVDLPVFLRRDISIDPGV